MTETCALCGALITERLEKLAAAVNAWEYAERTANGEVRPAVVHTFSGDVEVRLLSRRSSEVPR